MKKSICIFISSALFLAAGFVRGQDPQLSAGNIKEVVAAMTVEEKAKLVVGTGMRFGGGAEPEVLARTAPYLDVVSINRYTKNIEELLELFRRAHELTGKPIHHSEFSFLEKGRNGGEGGGTYPPVDSQRERGAYYRRFVSREVEVPYLIGFSWYEYTDPKPATNFGLVDRDDELYQEPVTIISEANRDVLDRFVEIIRSVHPSEMKKE